MAKPLGPPPKALFYSLLVVLIAFIPAMFEFAFRIRYPTLRYGIVLVTGRACWHVVLCCVCVGLIVPIAPAARLSRHARMHPRDWIGPSLTASLRCSRAFYWHYRCL